MKIVSLFDAKIRSVKIGSQLPVTLGSNRIERNQTKNDSNAKLFISSSLWQSFFLFRIIKSRCLFADEYRRFFFLSFATTRKRHQSLSLMIFVLYLRLCMLFFYLSSSSFSCSDVFCVLKANLTAQIEYVIAMQSFVLKGSFRARCHSSVFKCGAVAARCACKYGPVTQVIDSENLKHSAHCIAQLFATLRDETKRVSLTVIRALAPKSSKKYMHCR